MTDNRPPEKDRSQGNLGQKVAEQEKASDAKLEHMGGDQKSRPSDKRKERKEQKKAR